MYACMYVCVYGCMHIYYHLSMYIHTLTYILISNVLRKVFGNILRIGVRGPSGQVDSTRITGSWGIYTPKKVQNLRRRPEIYGVFEGPG